MTVKWPLSLKDVDRLHRKGLTSESRVEKSHPKYVRFENALKSLRDHITDRVKSTARIALPFIVETHVKHRTAIEWHDGTHVIYVDMTAYWDSNATQGHPRDFEIF